MSKFVCVICCLLMVAVSAPVRSYAAEVTAEPPASPAVGPVIDVGDLWKHLRHVASPIDANIAALQPLKDASIVLAPTIGSKPSTGLTAGISGNIAFVASNTTGTHLSSMTGGLRVSQFGQVLSGVKLAVFTPGDRWFIQGDNRLSWTSLTTYGLGEAPTANAETVKYDMFRVYEMAYRAIGPGVFVGSGISINHRGDIRAGAVSGTSLDEGAYVTYSQQHGFNLDRQTSSGTSVGLLLDTRDSGINARRGWMANATYRTFFAGFLGGDSTWQEATLDVRTYHAFTQDARRKLAFWFLGDMVAGGVAPYFDLPATAGDVYGRSARGYSEGRYRGERLLYGEVEYRETLTANDLIGFVTFLNTSTVGSRESGDRLFQAFAPAAGLGLRVLLNKTSRTNLCVDYGWGKQGSRGLYLAIQEAF